LEVSSDSVGNYVRNFGFIHRRRHTLEFTDAKNGHAAAQNYVLKKNSQWNLRSIRRKDELAEIENFTISADARDGILKDHQCHVMPL